jgi:hypothetical protein
MNRAAFVIYLALAFSLSSTASALPVAIANYQVHANVLWSDTGVDIDAGESLTLSSLGTAFLCTPADTPCAVSADGWAPGTPRPQNLAPDLTAYSLIGKVGVNGTSFLVDANFSGVVPDTGRLFLTMNDELGGFGDNSGFWTVERCCECSPRALHQRSYLHWTYALVRTSSSEPANKPMKSDVE